MPRYQERLVPYLIARGVQDRAMMESLTRKDLFQIEQAFQLFLEPNPTQALTFFLKGHVSLLEGYRPQIDHVGKELFGPLSFYLPLLKEMSSDLGLIYSSEQIFPSVSVIKTLQKDDPTLKGVTIGRIYFDPKKICLELFQAAPIDEKEPQKIEGTQNRRSLATNPIDHIAIRVDTIEELKTIHERICKMGSETLIAEFDKISYNEADNSFHTKARMKNPKETSFHKILEFIHYRYR